MSGDVERISIDMPMRVPVAVKLMQAISRAFPNARCVDEQLPTNIPAMGKMVIEVDLSDCYDDLDEVDDD